MKKILSQGRKEAAIAPASRQSNESNTEKSAKVLFFVCAAFSIVAVFTIVFYLLYVSIPVFREVGLFNFLFKRIWREATGGRPASSRGRFRHLPRDRFFCRRHRGRRADRRLFRRLRGDLHGPLLSEKNKGDLRTAHQSSGGNSLHRLRLRRLTGACSPAAKNIRRAVGNGTSRRRSRALHDDPAHRRLYLQKQHRSDPQRILRRRAGDGEYESAGGVQSLRSRRQKGDLFLADSRRRKSRRRNDGCPDGHRQFPQLAPHGAFSGRVHAHDAHRFRNALFRGLVESGAACGRLHIALLHPAHQCGIGTHAEGEKRRRFALFQKTERTDGGEKDTL